MREIKFRAWDEEDKRMIYLNLYQAECYDKDFILRENNEEDWIDDHCGNVKFPIMQYIGIKDKNGKEIYEGDIVKQVLNYPNRKMIDGKSSKIIWKNGYFSFSNGAILCDSVAKFNKVVGNIYENPELLER